MNINQSIIQTINDQQYSSVQFKKHCPSKIQTQKQYSSILLQNQSSMMMSINNNNNCIQQQSSILIKTQQKLQQYINTFKIKQVTTRSYKNIVEQIANSFTSLDHITQRLEEKVQYLLKQQQTEFVNSYKIHMNKIREEFHSYQSKIQQFNQKIKYYQNQGQMSNLLHKVNKLQTECKNLYAVINKKDKQLKDNQLTIKVQKSELKRYQRQIKILLRQKNNLILKNNQNNHQKQSDKQQNLQYSHHNETILTNNPTLFTTQVIQKRLNFNNKRKNISTQQQNINSCKSLQRNIESIISQRSFLNPQQSLLKKQHSPSSKVYDLNRIKQIQLKRQVVSLKKRNKILNFCQNNLSQSKSQLQTFFLNCVNQLKKDIKNRKKIKQCSLEDFRKQDKIQLLIKIISHEDILTYLYERIFHKKKINIETNNTISISSATVNINNLYTPQNKYINNKEKSLEKQSTDINTLNTAKNHKQTTRRDDKSTVQSKNNMLLLSKNRKFSKNISQNSLLPKISFNLQY